MFVGPGIEEHQRAGAETFDSTDIVFAKAAPFVQAARVSEDMSAARSVDMEVNCLLANRTLGEKRVKSPPNQQLYELHNPYRYMSHGSPPTRFPATLDNTSIRPKL